MGMVLTLMLALVAVLMLPGPSDEPEGLPGVLTAAPRDDCPFGIVRTNSMAIDDYADAMRGRLPNWIPEGFGLVWTYGAGQGTYTLGTWADSRCREIEFSASEGTARLAPGPHVGVWTIVSDAPHECGNNVLGTGRCLRYAAVASGRTYVLLMIGIDRDTGDAIARSIPLSVPFDGI